MNVLNVLSLRFLKGSHVRGTKEIAFVFRYVTFGVDEIVCK
jgi:hypothetical protein